MCSAKNAVPSVLFRPGSAPRELWEGRVCFDYGGELAPCLLAVFPVSAKFSHPNNVVLQNDDEQRMPPISQCLSSLSNRSALIGLVTIRWQQLRVVRWRQLPTTAS